MYRNIFINYDNFKNEFMNHFKFEKLEGDAPLKAFWERYIKDKDVEVYLCDPASEIGVYHDENNFRVGYRIEFFTDATNFIWKWVVTKAVKDKEFPVYANEEIGTFIYQKGKEFPVYARGSVENSTH